MATIGHTKGEMRLMACKEIAIIAWKVYLYLSMALGFIFYATHIPNKAPWVMWVFAPLAVVVAGGAALFIFALGREAYFALRRHFGRQR